jgi:hypothetical protein
MQIQGQQMYTPDWRSAQQMGHAMPLVYARFNWKLFSRIKTSKSAVLAPNFDVLI